MIYKRCIGCGNYFELNENSEDNKDNNYCSPNCYNEFEVCLVCGNYFAKDEIIRTKKMPCCKKCSEIL